RGGARGRRRVPPPRRERPPRRSACTPTGNRRPCTRIRSVISPRIDKLLENVDSNYASVIVAAKRARQINSYYHNLGEGLFDEFERDPMRGRFPDESAAGAHAGEAGGSHDPLSHLELVRNADVFLIAPASANTLAKLAHGLADNLLTSAALAATCPVLVAP